MLTRGTRNADPLLCAGVSSRLYYVLDGETRPGALDRVISMATDNDRANFAWMAEEGTKVDEM